MPWMLLAACADCPTFAEMTVSGDDSGEVAAVIAAFAAWTGREGVCVPGVEVVEAVGGDAELAGRYGGPGEPIQVAATSGSLARVVRHELCHALDAEEGLADALADTLDVHGVDATRYPDPALRTAEAFALVCEAGPAEVELHAALAAECGVAEPAGAEAVRAAAYSEAPAPAAVVVGAPPVAVSLGEGAGTRVVGAAGGEAGAWLRLARGGETWEAWWSAEGAPAEAVGVWSAGEAASAGERAAWSWYEGGVAGLGVGTPAAWTLRTDCGLGASGAVPAWIGGEPVWFTEDPTPVALR